MQLRHKDKTVYFNESANTAREFYISYISRYIPIQPGVKVFEIGCGLGGNLLPFAELQAEITGVDLSENKIKDARELYSQTGYKSHFIACDFLQLDEPSEEENKYDIAIVHDVIEHIYDKKSFVSHLQKFIRKGGVVFWAFPAWQMPFGGHQQLCKSRICSVLPYFHLLPVKLYRAFLKAFKPNDEGLIEALLDIKRCKTTIEHFEKVIDRSEFAKTDRCLWLINPHYKQKFNLRPRKLFPFLAGMKYIRNFFCTSCFYITTRL